MTITDIKPGPAEGKWTYGSGKTYKKPFLVFFSGQLDTSSLVNTTDARLPQIGWYLGAELNPTEIDLQTFCDDTDVKLANESQYAGASASGLVIYQASFRQINPQLNANPLSRIDVTWGGGEDKETVTKDVDGNAIVNSAHELYSNLPSRPIRGAECTVVIRQTANPAAMITQFSYSTNSLAAFGGNVAAENGLMGKITARYAQEDSIKYWEVSFPMKFRRDSWRLKLIDNGYVYTDDNDEQVAVTDAVGNQKATPTLLDGQGNPLNPGDDPVIYPSKATGQTADGYEINDKEDWNTLPLPNIFTFH